MSNTQIWAIPSTTAQKAAANVAKYEALKAVRPLTPNEAKLYLSSLLKLDNLSVSKLYKTLFETTDQNIKTQVATVWGGTVRPTFATFASYIPLGKDTDGNDAPYQYVSVWVGLNALAKHNKSAIAAAKVAKQGGQVVKTDKNTTEPITEPTTVKAGKVTKAAEKAAKQQKAA